MTRRTHRSSDGFPNLEVTKIVRAAI